MKLPSKTLTTILAASLFALSAPVGQAATTLVWDGGAGNNLLDSATNWNPDQVPAVSDVLRWDGSQAGNLNLLLNTSLVTTSPGMTIDITSGQTGSIGITNTATGTKIIRLNSGASTFAMASGAGAFSVGTSGNGTQFTVGPSVQTTHVATFTNNSVNAVTFGSKVTWVAGGGANSVINFTFAGSGNFSLQSNLCGDAAPSPRQITQNGTGVVTVSGNSTNISAATVNSGTLLLSGAGSINGGAGNVTVAAGATFINNSSVGFTKNLTLTEGLGAAGSIINGSGTFAAGNMTISSNLSDDFTTFALGSATLTKGGRLDLTLTNTTSGNYTLFSGGTIGGAFSSLYINGFQLTQSGSDFSGTNGGFGYTFTNTNNLLAVVPEPATWALLAFSLTTAMVLRRRRQS